MVKRPLVSVVDDDESVRESLPDLLREFGFAVQAFASAEEFLASDCVGKTRCLILDVAMPGMTGPELQQELTRRGQPIPIVFITAHGDETVRPRLLEQGAVECLLKPFSDAALARGARCGASVGLNDRALLAIAGDIAMTHDLATDLRCARSSPCRTQRPSCSSSTTTSRCANRWNC